MNEDDANFVCSMEVWDERVCLGCHVTSEPHTPQGAHPLPVLTCEAAVGALGKCLTLLVQEHLAY